MESKNYDTFNSEELVIKLKEDILNIPLSNNLDFGRLNTDHMVEIDWNCKIGWSKPMIKPFKALMIHPFNSTLHYALGCFEGIKAYKNEQGDILLFRPELNMERFLKSNIRSCFPKFDTKELLNVLIEYIKIEKNWISEIKGSSLYIRPFTISTENSLNLIKPNSSKILIVSSPVKEYFNNSKNLLKLIVDEEYERGTPKNNASYKMGSNYAPTILISEEYKKKGYSQVIWTHLGNMIESGASNLFFVIKDEDKKILITHPKDNCILHGITRQSVLELAKEDLKEEISETQERKFHIDEFIKLYNENKIIEVFMTGTAIVITKVDVINIRNIEYNLNINSIKNEDNFSFKVKELLLNIQRGIISHKFSKKIN